MDESYELLKRPNHTGDEANDSASTRPLLHVSGIGKPGRKRYVTFIDIATLVLSFWAVGVAVQAIRYPNLAVKLGQTYQLVLLGFLLSVMGFGVKRQAQLLMLTMEAHYGDSTLQNYDAILRNDNFAPSVGKALRLYLLLLFLLPLGLSASYKTFNNGKTILQLPPASGYNYELAGAVGNFSWIGLALMANVTLPIQTKIRNLNQSRLQTPSVHGFNMYVIDDNNTAMLDSPTEFYLDSIQTTLREGRSLSKGLDEEVHITARVGATICRVNKDSIAPVNRSAYWDSVYTRYQNYSSIGDDTGYWAGILTSWEDLTFVGMSAWQGDNSDDGGDYNGFKSNAIGYDIRRGQCDATWRVTKDSIYLTDASSCIDTAIRKLLTDNVLDLGNFYLPSLLEYIGLPGTAKDIWTSIVAAMVWSRLAASIDNGTRGRDELHYLTNDTSTWTMQTVHKSWILYSIMSIQPIIIVVILVVRAVLYSSPVTEGFGIITLLAGLSPDSANVLRGATLTGKLSQVVKVQMVAVQHGDGSHDEQGFAGGQEDHFEYIIDGKGRNSTVSHKKTYG